jgi:conjugal transfer mating pair stabilization protein TraN
MRSLRFALFYFLVFVSLVPGVVVIAQQAQNTGTYKDGVETAKEASRNSQSLPSTDDAFQDIQIYTEDPGQISRDDAENPGALTTQGAQQASYGDLVISNNRQPKYDPNELKALIGPSNIVAKDPQTYLGGTDASGNPISCQPVPFGGGTPTTYETSCNAGAAVTDVVSSCTIPLRVNVVNNNTYRYTCATTIGGVEEDDTCTAFLEPRAQGVCTVTNRRVINTCPSGQIRRFCDDPVRTVIQTLSCRGPVEGETPISVVQAPPTITETRDETSCLSLASSSSCQNISEVCTDPQPSTRVINGVSVTRSCWDLQRSYNCSAITGGNSDCQSLDQNPLCRYDRTECLDENPTAGSCLVEDRIYTCTSSAASQGATTAYVCADGIYCVNGECQTVEAEPSADFPKAVAALNSISQAGKELNADTITIFNGTDQRCSKPVFGLTNCCNGGSGIPLIGSCSAEEQQLSKAVDAGLTHRVGSYCSKSFLGVCSSRKTTYCVFQSKLGRLIQEQGRPQIGLSWGTPKSPVCRGLSPDEFSRLDLSRFDFSEVINDLAAVATIPNETEALSDLQAKIRAYYSQPVR